MLGLKDFRFWLEDRWASGDFRAYQLEQQNENWIKTLFANEQGKEFSIDYIGPDSIAFFFTFSRSMRSAFFI